MCSLHTFSIMLYNFNLCLAFHSYRAQILKSKQYCQRLTFPPPFHLSYRFPLQPCAYLSSPVIAAMSCMFCMGLNLCLRRFKLICGVQMCESIRNISSTEKLRTAEHVRLMLSLSTQSDNGFSCVTF